VAGNPIFSRLMAIIAGLSVLHPRADWGRRTPSRALSKPALDVLQRAFCQSVTACGRLRGQDTESAKPADLSVEQPTKFELATPEDCEGAGLDRAANVAAAPSNSAIEQRSSLSTQICQSPSDVAWPLMAAAAVVTRRRQDPVGSLAKASARSGGGPLAAHPARRRSLRRRSLN